MHTLTDAEAQMIQAGRHHHKPRQGRGRGQNMSVAISQLNLAINVAINGGIINNIQTNYAALTSFN